MDALVSSVDVLKTATTSSSKRSRSSTEAMEKAGKDFESVFMAQMLKPMWDSVATDGMFGGGPGEDVMKDLLVQEYGKSMAAGDTSGLSDSIVQAMVHMQEVADSHIS